MYKNVWHLTHPHEKYPWIEKCINKLCRFSEDYHLLKWITLRYHKQDEFHQSNWSTEVTYNIAHWITSIQVKLEIVSTQSIMSKASIEKGWTMEVWAPAVKVNCLVPCSKWWLHRCASFVVCMPIQLITCVLYCHKMFLGL